MRHAGWRAAGGLGSLLLAGACGLGGGLPCRPGAGGPYWVEEGETVEFQVSCATGRALAGSAVRVAPLPPGASWDEARRAFRWTPGSDQAAVYTLALLGPGREKGWVKVGVADKWSDPANVPVVDPVKYTEEYGLPVIHLQLPEPPVDGRKVAATVIARGRTYQVKVVADGEPSEAYPKRSYTLLFPKGDAFEETLTTEDFSNRRTLVLLSDFDDNSHLRARLTLEVWRRLSFNAIHRGASSAVVFLNGAYHGLYTVVDRVDEYLLARNKLNRAGNLYRAEEDSANFLLTDAEGSPKSPLSLGFAKLRGTPRQGEPGAFDDLEELIQYLAAASPDEIRLDTDERVFLRDYEDWWILSNLLQAPGAERWGSYHFHDPNGGTWRYVPWHVTGSFGQDSRTARVPPRIPLEDGARNGILGRLLGEPIMGGPLRARFASLLDTDLSEQQLQALVQKYAEALAPSAHRDELKWGSTYRSYPDWAARSDFTSFDEEVEYLQRWIPQRWAFLREALRAQ